MGKQATTKEENCPRLLSYWLSHWLIAVEVSNSSELPRTCSACLGVPNSMTLAGEQSPIQEHENGMFALSQAPLQLRCGHMTLALPIRPPASVSPAGVNNIKSGGSGSASSSSQSIQGTILAGGVKGLWLGVVVSQLWGFALPEGDSGVFIKQVVPVCGWPLFYCMILSPVLQNVLWFCDSQQSHMVNLFSP